MILLRSEFLLLGLILLLLSSILAVKRFGWRRIILPGLLSLTLATTVVAPWTYRNYRLFGTFVPVLSHPWYEIWRGNNAIAVGTTLDEKGNVVWVESSHFPGLIKEMDSLPYDATFEIRTDAMFKREVLQFWSTEPSRAISLGIRKLAFFFTIDFNHPASGSPFYFVSMIAVIIGVSLGFYQAFRDRHQEKTRSVLLIYSVFLLFYLSLTAATVMLPRYQIYVWTTLVPMIGLSRLKFRTAHDKSSYS
jgi:hypothetical protein